MNRVQVKICGVTRIDDAKKCVEFGADMIGLNFYRQSPRYIGPEIARKIVEALPDGVRPVGVFVEPTADQMREITTIVDLSCVQLHGNIPPEVCRELAREFRVIRALRTGDHFRPEDAQLFSDCDVLVDAHHPELHGGTGRTCDWTTARATRAHARLLILSGGLNPGNVGEAIAAVSPDAVDVCSGVESAPGVKDRDAIKKFIAAVRVK